MAREVARLERAGLLVTEQVGTAKTIRPAPDLPYGPVLRQLLAYAGGVIPMLERAFGDNTAIDEVFIFGSWAARYAGEAGAPRHESRTPSDPRRPSARSHAPGPRARQAIAPTPRARRSVKLTTSVAPHPERS